MNFGVTLKLRRGHPVQFIWGNHGASRFAGGPAFKPRLAVGSCVYHPRRRAGRLGHAASCGNGRRQRQGARFQMPDCRNVLCTVQSHIKSLQLASGVQGDGGRPERITQELSQYSGQQLEPGRPQKARQCPIAGANPIPWGTLPRDPAKNRAAVYTPYNIVRPAGRAAPPLLLTGGWTLRRCRAPLPVPAIGVLAPCCHCSAPLIGCSCPAGVWWW